MNIRLRLALLLGGLLLTLAAAVWFMHQTQEREAALMLANISTEREQMLDQLLELNGQSLRSFSTDYSLWSEMVGFLQSGDKQWAAINIDASLANFGVAAAWVLRADGTLHYSASRLGSVPALPFEAPGFLARLREQRMLHFFHDSPAGLLEVRTAPIQPSEDTARASPALGWLIVARLWDDEHVRRLASPMQSVPSWNPAAAPTQDGPLVRVRRDFRDWRGGVVRTLCLDYRPVSLANLLEGNHRETYLFYAFGLTVITFIFVGVSRWVISPLHRLNRAMEEGRPEALNGLASTHTEFGHLAQLVEQSFSQRAKLEREVAERARVEVTLREAEAGLRRSLEFRARLARDLHDGIIQSIYAAGLGLEGVRSVMREDPALADQRLAGSQKALNATIAEVRNFITGLEPEHVPANRLSFSDALASLAGTMEGFQQVRITLDVDASVARRISPEQELHAFQIVRESLSNALRHAAARSVRLSLQPQPAGEALLTVADDGVGFDAALRSGAGRGLSNLATRARDLGGTLTVDSAPGQGTRISLRFTPTQPPPT